MKKVNWNEVQEIQNYVSLPVDGYVCAIKKVTDFPEKEYLLIEYDIIEGEFKNHFQKQYDNDTRNPKKWSGTFTKSYKDGKPQEFFKGFLTALEKSNTGFKWDGVNEQYFVKKKFGCTTREEEYQKQNGGIGVRVSVDMVHSVEAIKEKDFVLKEKKLLAGSVQLNSSNIPFVNPFEDNDSKSVFGDNDEIDPFM